MMNYSNDATGKKWLFLSRCAQKMMFFPVFVYAMGQKTGFCSRCAQETRNNCFCAQTLREWRSISALECHEKGDDCATHRILIRVVQLMWLGVGYNWDKVRHRLG